MTDTQAADKAKDTRPNVLVIFKPDKTTAVVPLSNEAVLKAFSGRLPAAKKWEFKIMTAAEGDLVPFRNPDYVTPGEAKTVATKLQAENRSLSDKNKELLERIAALEANSKKDAGTGDSKEDTDDKNKKVDTSAAPRHYMAVIKDIKAATTPEEIDALIGEDKRPAVIKAGAEKKDELALS